MYRSTNDNCHNGWVLRDRSSSVIRTKVYMLMVSNQCAMCCVWFSICLPISNDFYSLHSNNSRLLSLSLSPRSPALTGKTKTKTESKFEMDKTNLKTRMHKHIREKEREREWEMGCRRWHYKWKKKVVKSEQLKFHYSRNQKQQFDALV